jgi:hypothetical protein
MTGTQKWIVKGIVKIDPIWHGNCLYHIEVFKSPPEENAPQLIPQLVGLFIYDKYTEVVSERIAKWKI